MFGLKKASHNMPMLGYKEPTAYSNMVMKTMTIKFEVTYTCIGRGGVM